MNRSIIALAGAVLLMSAVPFARNASADVSDAENPSICLYAPQASGTSASQQDKAQADESAQDQRESERDAREQARDAEERARDAREAARDRYEAALDAIDDSRWEEGREKFDEIVHDGGSNMDAALYWRAYCENKLGRRADALASISELEHKYPQSRWQNDAKALDLQVRNETGQAVSPQSQDDEELKLLAINSLMQSDPSQALPLLEKVLNGSGSPKLKERALFVLAQSGSPEASQILVRIAQGNSNPDLQSKAVKYLGLFGGSRGLGELSQIYSSSSDEDVKHAILQSFMIAGAKDRLFATAQNEKNPDLQSDAVRLLGVSGASDDLWKLYQAGAADDVRRSILQAMFISGDAEHLQQLAKTEKNEDLRLAAIRDMGLMGGERTGSTLVSMYAGTKDPATSKAVLQALFLQGNAQAIVDIARKETDPELKKAAVQKLSLMHSKVATDYLLEILNK